jgi:deoxyribodipyrimidine photolyase-related protein
MQKNQIESMNSSHPKKTLRLVLGDQLNEQHSWFKGTGDHVTYVLMEVRTETDYVKHHIQKICSLFLGMRSFAERLTIAGHQVHYVHISDSNNKGSFEKNLQTIIDEGGFERFEYQLPDEYRVDELLKCFCQQLKIAFQAVDTEHFFTKRTELSDFFHGKKQFVMESFYRAQRKRFNILMDGQQPLGGQWNFDRENRKKLPSTEVPPHPLTFRNDASALFAEIQHCGIAYIGQIEPMELEWPIDRQQALRLLHFFLDYLLEKFGTYEDAMSTRSWSVYHSRLSFALNCKLLSPIEVVDAAVATFHEKPDAISLNQVEGFVRQILGWREFMRGVYWSKMPEFSQLNFFKHHRALPNWFWSGKTKMNCLKHSIDQSLSKAYAHHIQRLMVLGNFCLLAGINPDDVDQWYLGIYIDAFEWVEITNTRGMSQFADGGIIGSKPYVSSAAYIHKMSDYCSTCYYKKDLKTGENSCPFNSLYWHFHQEHRDLLEKNPRIGMAFNTWDKMEERKRTDLLKQAEFYLKNLEQL